VFISALIIASFLHYQSQFIAVYAVLVGLPSGLMFMIPLNCGWQYFPDRKGQYKNNILIS
jgi:hypothetical protein